MSIKPVGRAANSTGRLRAHRPIMQNSVGQAFLPVYSYLLLYGAGIPACLFLSIIIRCRHSCLSIPVYYIYELYCQADGQKGCSQADGQKGCSQADSLERLSYEFKF